jgi:hypothetical protein
MNNENIKIGKVWIESYESIMIKCCLMFCILILIIVLTLLNVFFLPVFLIYSIFFIDFTIKLQLINNFTLVVNYTTNVDFDEYVLNDLDWLISIKKYYENETAYEKQQKYKISKKRFLYYSNARDAKDWLNKQNEEFKNMKLNQF